jgi:hypothetical protein
MVSDDEAGDCRIKYFLLLSRGLWVINWQAMISRRSRYYMIWLYGDKLNEKDHIYSLHHMGIHADPVRMRLP